MNFRRTGIILVAASVIVMAIALLVVFIKPGRGALTASNRRVAVINLTCTIAFNQEMSLLSGGTGTGQTMRDLEQAEKDPSLRAVVIRIDSPGGSAAASQELYAQVLRLKKSGKKVVASFGDIAASGGYYVGVACDRIVANPATTTGSIGVIAQVPNLQELYRKIGVTQQTFKSGAHKDMLSPARPVTPEEAQIMQGIIDDTYDQFVRAVASGRHLPIERVRSLADGRIYTGAQAKRLGLVDELGGLSDAVRLAAKLAGIKGEPEVVEYSRTGLFDFLRELGVLGGLQGWSPEALFVRPLLPVYTTIQY